MADLYSEVPELAAEAQALQRRQKIAEALALQAQQPLQTNMMAGNYVVPVSPLSGIAKVMNSYSAQKQLNDYDTGMKGLATRKSQMIADEILRNQQLANGTPAVPGQTTVADTSQEGTGAFDVAGTTGPETTTTGGTAAVPANPRQAAINAMMSQFAPVQRYGQVALQDLNRKEDKATAIEQRQWELTQKAEQRLHEIRLAESEKRITKAEADARAEALKKELAANQDALRRELAANSNAVRIELAASRRADADSRRADASKPPAGFRFKPNGDLERIPGGPADIKAESELQKKAAGAGDVDVALSSLRDAYDRLEKGGGITSTENAGLSNVIPSISSSGVGQAAGKLFGTNNQSARNDIAMARPALLAALMRATGMSSKQMDSNAELKLWLSTATDPTLDVESNRRALDNIEKKYIGGAKPRPITPAAPVAAGTPPPGAVQRLP